MAGNFDLQTVNSYDSGLVAKIGANSAVIDVSEAVSLSGGFIIKSIAGGTIEGISATVKTFDSDNQTVAQDKVVYRPVNQGDTYRMTTDAAITAANVGSYFDINTTSQTVDVATLSATTGQVRLEKFESATVGIFSIANA